MSEPIAKARGVSVAEKRALVGDAWPNCSCHGEPMRWNKRAALLAGGSYVCPVKCREHGALYYRRHIEKMRERAVRIYRDNPDGGRKRARRQIRTPSGSRISLPDMATVEFARTIRDDYYEQRSRSCQ